MFKEFKEFALKGNVIDLAVGVIIGGAFGKIVSSLVDDVIMPPIGKMMGGLDFKSLFINLSDIPYATIADAKKAGAPTINYGIFANTVIDFVILAFVIFLMVRKINSLKRAEAPAPVTTKACPFCLSDIPLKAKRCPHCTSAID